MNILKGSSECCIARLHQKTCCPTLPLLAAVGIAYWLELKMFEHYGVPNPVLLLRNSFDYQ